MADPRFYDNRGPISLGEIAGSVGAVLGATADPASRVRDVAEVATASAGDLCYAVTTRYLDTLSGDGGAIPIIVTPPLVAQAERTGALVLSHDNPVAAFAAAATLLYPETGRAVGSRLGQAIDPTAKIAHGVVMEAGVVVGPGAEIGEGSHIAANAVIGRGVCIGRDCFIGPASSVLYALIGDRVVLHGGARIGSDGFSYAYADGRHRKIPHLGRVIIQDDVEIGAGTCIDRGALRDTTIGEGAKIDNLVQIAHNAAIGRGVLMAACIGLSGSVTIGDWTVMGGQAGVADHVEIGSHARIAAKTGVSRSLEGRADYAGYPVQPAGQWRREVAMLRRMTKGQKRRDE